MKKMATDAEFLKRLQETAPEVFKEEVNFDSALMRIMQSKEQKRKKTLPKAKDNGTRKPARRSKGERSAGPKQKNSPDEQGEESPNILRAYLKIPESVIADYQTGQYRQERRDKYRIIVEWLTFFAVLGYGTVAYFQWDAMRESNLINREALISVQRAYVSFKTIESTGIRDAQGRITGWRFFPQWENRGAQWCPI